VLSTKWYLSPQSSQTTIDNSTNMKNTRRGVGFVESTTKEDAKIPMVKVEDALEISKSPRIPRPKKDT